MKIPSFITFALVILFSIIIIPNLSILFRPNLILIYVLLFSLNLGFIPNLWYWIIGGIFLDSFTASHFPINSIIFISFFILSFVFLKILDFKTKMSKIVMAFTFIFSYYLTFFVINHLTAKSFNYNLILYAIETFLIFLLIFNINYRRHYERTFEKL